MEANARKNIRKLKDGALDHGDLRMAINCDLALAGPDAPVGAEPGTEAWCLWQDLRAEMSRKEWQALAVTACARVIAYARAESEGL